MVWKKRLPKLLAFGIVMLLMLQLVTFLLVKNDTATECHVRGFYREPDNTLDVAVIGCSEMYADYSPPLAYKYCGFTSYNLCTSGMPPCFYKSALKEFCKTQDPQVVVFEVNGFFYNEEFGLTEVNRRNWLDNIHLSKDWFDDVLDTAEPDELLDYLLPINKYHDNWQRPYGQYKRLKSISKLYTENGVSLMKSFGTRTTNNSRIHTTKKRALRLTDFGRENLLDLMDYCKEQGMENVLFIRSPHRQKLASATSAELEKVISEAGYTFIDCDKISKDIGIDDAADYYNEDHMNVFGNEKFTKYLGEYIVENYDLKTDHDEETKKLWKECEDYTVDAFKVLKERTLTNEDLPYYETTDLGEETHEQLLKAEANARKKLAERQKQNGKAAPKAPDGGKPAK